MSEAFIAHACNAFNNAWTTGNQLVVDCQPLTDALTSISLTVATLQHEIAQLREQNEQFRTLHLQSQSETSTLRTKTDDLASSVHNLLDTSTGMVGRQEVLAKFELTTREADIKHKDLLELITAKVNAMNRAADDDRQRVMNLSETVDSLRTAQLEGLSALRQQNLQSENNLRGLNAERCQAHLQLTAKHDEHVAQTQTKLASLKDDVNDKMNKNRDFASESLAKNVDELLQHLDRQAQRVDGLQRAISVRDASMPTKQEIEKLIRAMEDSRFAVDESQVRLQETFAQCMSLLETSAFNTNNNNNGNNIIQFSQQQQQQQVPVRSSSSTLESSTSRTRAPSAMNPLASSINNNNNSFPDKSSLQNNNNSINHHHHHHHNNHNNLPAFATIFENRLDKVQQLIERILQEELPWLASESKAKHEDHIILVQAQKRAENMLVAICDVCGLGTPETLAAALRMSTVTKAQQIIQNGLKKLLNPTVMEEIFFSSPQILERLKSILGGTFVTSTSLQTSLSQQQQQREKEKENYDARLSSLSAQQLLKAPALAAANQRYVQAVQARNGSVKNPGDSPTPAASLSVTPTSQNLSAISNTVNEQLRLGVDISDVTFALPTSPGNSRAGVGIMALSRGGVADRSGLHKGDVFVKIDGNDVRSCEQFMVLVQTLDRRFKTECKAKNIYPCRGSVDVTVLRDNTTVMNLALKLEWS